MINKRIRSQRKTEPEAIAMADELVVSTKQHIRDIVNKERLYYFIQTNYDIVVIPSYVFTKLEAIYKGTYKGMSRPIPPEDFLDMLEQKWNELCKLAAWKQISDQIGRLNYDIAVILGMSTKYYKWKDSQKTKAQEIKEMNSKKQTNYELIGKKSTEKNIATTENYIIDEEDED